MTHHIMKYGVCTFSNFLLGISIYEGFYNKNPMIETKVKTEFDVTLLMLEY